ncbi:MAG: carbohydrate porin, partial [Pyrinomonadaceae bacterium]|nr:carbohydrate porin [Phycisphaerales bacterium]
EGTQGFYVSAEQQLITRGDSEEDLDKGLFVFAKYARGDKDVAECEQSVGLGACLHGTFGDRTDDQAGIFVGWADLSNDPMSGYARDETAIEFFYKVAITPFLSLKPDLQYIINPSGDPGIHDAVVGSIRLELTF